MIDKIKSIPGAGLFKGLFSLQSIPVLGSYLELFRKAGKEEIKSVRNSKKIVENTKQTGKVTQTIVSNTKKLTEEQTKQLALKKAQAVLDASSKVMDMDLIQNTAALMGKITADETLRLKLQQAILLGNSTEAGNLAQQLLATQLAAMKLSSSNPLGGFTDGLMAALKGARELRDELAKLGAPKVAVPSMPAAVAAATKSYTTYGGITAPSDFGLPSTVANTVSGGGRFVSNNPNAAVNELRIIIDPSAAQYGIGVASVNNSANGNKNNYSTIQSFSGG
jgi:hypothetical protein